MKCGVDCACVRARVRRDGKVSTKKLRPEYVEKGAVYDVDGRKGLLTIRLCERVNLREDKFFEAEIVSGNVAYASADNNLMQKIYGKGTPGYVETFRTTLTHFKRRRPGLEANPHSSKEPK